MLDIAKNSGNGSNSSAPVSGRGLAHRKMTHDEQLKLAADLATGERQFEPSLSQVADLVGVSTAKLRAELKARAATLRAKQQEEEAAARFRRLQAEADLNGQAGAVVDAWRSASPAARETAVRSIGTAEVWDYLARIID
jgi:hypothetical protein